MTQHKRLDQRLILWLSLAQLTTWGGVFYMFAVVMEPVERELGLSRAQSSLAFSLALLAEGLCAYPVGRWIDRGHERLVLSCGSLLAGVCLLSLGMVSSRAELYAVWTALGVAMAATLYSPVFAIVTRRFPEDFRRGIITLTFLGGLASTVFIPLSAWLVSVFGWRHAMWWLAALQLLGCAPIHFLVLKGAPAGPGQSRAGDAARPMAQFLTSPSFLYVGAFVVLMMAVTAALPAHMVSLLRENGLQEAWVIAIPASIGVIQVFGRALLYFFEQHFDLHLANRLIPCLMPLGLGALLLAPWAGSHDSRLGLGILGLFVLLFGLGNGMLTIVKGTAIAQYVNRDHVASLNGALGFPLALARAAAPLLLGLLWSREVGYSYGLWLLLGLSSVASVSLVLAQRRAGSVPSARGGV